MAEKPSVAKAIAMMLSGGKKRERGNVDGWAPMCRLHDFFTYFAPARGKCSKWHIQTGTKSIVRQ